jgi:hypothetical protein
MNAHSWVAAGGLTRVQILQSAECGCEEADADTARPVTAFYRGVNVAHKRFAKKLKRVVRDRRFIPEEAARDRKVPNAIEGEEQEIFARHAALESVRQLLAEFKDARRSADMSLGDIEKNSGMDRSGIAKP